MSECMTLYETARLCTRLYPESDRVSQSKAVSDVRSREPRTSDSGNQPGCASFPNSALVIPSRAHIAPPVSHQRINAVGAH